MPLRPPAGFISAFYDPLKVADAPTIGTGTAGDAQASVTFTAPSNVGGSAITAYYAVSDPGQFTGNAASSPVTVTGLSNGTAYTFRVWALNSYGPSPYSAATGSVTPAEVRGLFGGGGGGGGSYGNVIDYIAISTTGNATDFGDLTVGRNSSASCASSSRGVWLGGSSSSGRVNVIDYVTIDSTGNATDFGDLAVATYVLSACSSNTRGVTGGGYTTTFISQMVYITIASTGNSTNFGNMTAATSQYGACSSNTRGIFGGGYVSGFNVTNTIEYITIATTGNATDFGDLTVSRGDLAACSSSTRGLFGGGTNVDTTRVNIIDYITIASTGNAIDFGDLAVAPLNPSLLSSCSSSLRGIFAGGQADGTTGSNTIQYVTIATTGNSSDFGDLTIGRDGLSACSNAHGGLS